MLYTKESSRIENYIRVWKALSHECTCEYCGDSFKAGNPNAKYCSQRCRNDVYMKRRTEIHNQQCIKYCTVCGEKYKAKKKDSQYCSNACKQKAYRNRKNVTDCSCGEITTT